MSTRKILVLDTETGGLDAHENSILSLAGVVWNDGVIEDEYSVLINEPELNVTPQALKVNGYTEEEIREKGLPPAQAVAAWENFLLKNDLRPKVVVGGHNVSFDISFVQRLYKLAGRDYLKTYSYRPLCTQIGAILLDQAGVIKPKGTSLDYLAEYFGITIRFKARHDALEDAKAAARILTKEIELIRRK